jgi:hypothetical protein
MKTILMIFIFFIIAVLMFPITVFYAIRESVFYYLSVLRVLFIEFTLNC